MILAFTFLPAFRSAGSSHFHVHVRQLRCLPSSFTLPSLAAVTCPRKGRWSQVP